MVLKLNNSQTDQPALSREELSLKDKLLRVTGGDIVSIRILPVINFKERLEFNPLVNRFSSPQDGPHPKKRLELEVKKGVCVIKTQNSMATLFRQDRQLQADYTLWVRAYDPYYKPNSDSRQLY